VVPVPNRSLFKLFIENPGASATRWASLKRLVLLVVLVCCGCMHKETPRNVILVTLDTTRADRLGCYGYPNAQTPHLDRLAAGGVRCDNAVAHQPQTLASHTSMLTGLLPFEHGVRYNDNYTLRDEFITAAEVLRDHGIRTSAFISAMVLSEVFGLDQGFEVYDEDFTAASYPPERRSNYLDRPAEDVNRAAFAWLDEHPGEQFFIWIHYWDPHHPYLPPEPFASRFAENLYDGEIAYVDHCLGQLLAKLKELGLKDHTDLLLVGDHGEGLGDHDEPTHGVFTYDTTIRVPLILFSPGKVEAGQILKTPVGVRDVAPTLLDLFGLTPPPSWSGASLLNTLRREGAQTEETPIYFESFTARLAYEWSSLRGLRTSKWKYIQAPAAELYELEKDPGELRNVLDRYPEIAEKLASELAKSVEKDPGLWAPGATLELSAEMRENLAALGYLEVSGEPSVRGEQEEQRPDPKTMLDVLGLLKASEDALRAGAFEFALEQLEQARQRDPDNPQILKRMMAAHHSLGDSEKVAELREQLFEKTPSKPEEYRDRAALFKARQQWEQAITHYELASAFLPKDASLFLELGLCQARLNRLEPARESFERAVSLNPQLASARMNLGNLLLSLKRPEEASEHLRIAMQIKPGLVEAEALWGLAAIMAGRTDEGYNRLRRLADRLPERISADSATVYDLAARALSNGGFHAQAAVIYGRLSKEFPRNLDWRNCLGASLARQGKYDFAFEQFEQVLREDPQNLVALNSLGTCLYLKRQYPLAVSTLERAVAVDPHHAASWESLALAYEAAGDTAQAEKARQRLLQLRR